MKKLIQGLIALLGAILFSIHALAGTWTGNSFLYKPALGARGATEKSTYDSGLDRVDTRLGKEIWVGDPLYGSTLQNAVTAISSSNVILRLPAGTHSINADLTIPANITLKVERGATLAVATTKTLTINGGLEAGLYQIFSCTGSGKVLCGKNVREVYPQWFGAKADGATDDGATIQKTALALQSSGCRRLVFPPGTYRIYSVGTSYTSLGIFTSFTDGLELLGHGATLEVDPARETPTSIGCFFWFYGCKRILVDGFYVVGPPDMLNHFGTSGAGTEFCDFYEGCDGISMPFNEGKWMVSLAKFTKGVNDPESYRSKNINIGIAKTYQCQRVIQGQYSGDNLNASLLSSEGNFRSYFFYGAKNHKVHIVSKNHQCTDIILCAWGGYGCQNIDITYENVDSDSNPSNSNFIEFLWEATPGTFRNIKINMDIKYTTQQQYAVLIAKYTDQAQTTRDDKDRGHRFENITFSGQINGNNVNTVFISTYGECGCKWGYDTSLGTDVFSNIKLENLKLVNCSSGYVRWDLGALKDNFTMINLVSDTEFKMYPSTITSYGYGRIVPINCDIPNLWTTTSAYCWGIMRVTITSNTTFTALDSGKTISNYGASTACSAVMPPATPGLEFNFIREASQRLRVDPNGSEVIRGGGAGKMLYLESDGAAVKLKCYTAGTWEIISLCGTTSWEP